MFNPTEYFKNIAIAHKQILHTDDKPAFFREFSSSRVILDNSDLLQKMRTAADIVMVSQFNGNTNYNDGIDNNARTHIGSIFLIKKVKVTDYDAIEVSREELSVIWEDIYAKIKKDVRTNVLKIFNVSAQKTSIGAIADNYYGISVFFSYSEVICHKYSDDVWT